MSTLLLLYVLSQACLVPKCCCRNTCLLNWKTSQAASWSSFNNDSYQTRDAFAFVLHLHSHVRSPWVILFPFHPIIQWLPPFQARQSWCPSRERLFSRVKHIPYACNVVAVIKSWTTTHLSCHGQVIYERNQERSGKTLKWSIIALLPLFVYPIPAWMMLQHVVMCFCDFRRSQLSTPSGCEGSTCTFVHSFIHSHITVCRTPCKLLRLSFWRQVKQKYLTMQDVKQWD